MTSTSTQARASRHPHGMALHKSRGPGRQLFRGGGCFSGGLPLPVLPPPSPAFDIAFSSRASASIRERSFAGQLRVLLGGGVEMIIRRALIYLDSARLDAFAGCSGFSFAQTGSHAVGRPPTSSERWAPFDPHIFLFHLVNLAMHKTVSGPAGGPAYPPYRAGLFGRLLLCQLFLCGRSSFSPAFPCGTCCRRLFLLAFLPEF